MLGAPRLQPGRTVPALAAVLASRAEPDCAHTGRTPRAGNRSGQPTIGTRETTTERQPHRLTATRQVERESLRSYWTSSTCFSPYNVVRIQLRGAAGLGRAQTTRIPNGEGERDIADPSRVSCNAELARLLGKAYLEDRAAQGRRGSARCPEHRQIDAVEAEVLAGSENLRDGQARRRPGATLRGEPIECGVDRERRPRRWQN